MACYPIVPESKTGYQASGPTITTTLGTHQANDILLVAVTSDGGGTVISADATSTTAGWAAIGSQVSNDNHRYQFWWLRAAGAGTTPPVFNVATASSSSYISIIVRGGKVASTPIHATPARSDHSSYTAGLGTMGTLTPTISNGLLIFGACTDGAAIALRWKSSRIRSLAYTDQFPAETASTTFQIVGYRAQDTAASAAISAETIYSSDTGGTPNGGTGWVICIEPDDDTDGSCPNISPDMDEICWHGNFGAVHHAFTVGGAAEAPSTTITGGATVDGVAVSAVVGTVTQSGSQASTMLNSALGTSTIISSTEDCTTPKWVGAVRVLSSPISMTGKIWTLHYSFGPSLPSVSRFGEKGFAVLFADSSGYWEVHQIANRAAIRLQTERTCFIDVEDATPLASGGGGAINWGDITRVGPLYHRIGLAGVTTALTFQIKNEALLTKTLVTGGSASYPAEPSLLKDAICSMDFYNLAQTLGAGLELKYPVQVGDGTKKTYWDASTTLVGYPQARSLLAANSQQDWNVGAGQAALTYKFSSSDVINIGASLLSSSQAQIITVDAASAVPATFTTTGNAIVGHTVTDNKGLAWNGVTVQECGTFTLAGGGDLTTCTFSKTTDSTAPLAITANGTVLATSTLSRLMNTGASATYHATLGAAVTETTWNGTTLSDGTVKIYSGYPETTVASTALVTGRRYKIKTAGTTTWTSVGAADNNVGTAFTATGTAAGTGDAYAGIIITTDGAGTSIAAGDVTTTTANVPVYIAAPQPTLSATVLANTRALLWNRTTSAELDNTFIAGTSYSKVITSGASSGDILDLYTFKEGYAESRATISYSGANATFAVDQVVDTSIDYYRTQESITDYTTLTEYDFYSPDIYIQADDSDGENKLARLFIFYNGVLTTADGATFMRGGITFNSPFDVVINRSVRAIAVDNVSVTHGLHFTDEDTIRVTTDDGTSWIAPPSAPGSIRYAFGVSPGQIETGISGVTSQDITDIAAAAATAVVGNSKTLTVPKFLGLK